MTDDGELYAYLPEGIKCLRCGQFIDERHLLKGWGCPRCPYGSAESAPPIVCEECGVPIEGEWRRIQVPLCGEHRRAALAGTLGVATIEKDTETNVVKAKTVRLDGTTGHPPTDLPRPAGPPSLSVVPAKPGVDRSR